MEIRVRIIILCIYIMLKIRQKVNFNCWVGTKHFYLLNKCLNDY